MINLLTLIFSASAACTVSGPVRDAQFVGMGNPIKQMQRSRDVVAIPVPTLPGDRTFASIAMGESPSVGSPQPVTIEMSINQCRGMINTDQTNFCNLRSTNGNYNNITWVPKASANYPNATAANRAGLCWAPESEGQWYMNIKWTYDVCGFGLVECGFAIQYN